MWALTSAYPSLMEYWYIKQRVQRLVTESTGIAVLWRVTESARTAVERRAIETIRVVLQTRVTESTKVPRLRVPKSTAIAV